MISSFKIFFLLSIKLTAFIAENRCHQNVGGDSVSKLDDRNRNSDPMGERFHRSQDIGNRSLITIKSFFCLFLNSEISTLCKKSGWHFINSIIFNLGGSRFVSTPKKSRQFQKVSLDFVSTPPSRSKYLNRDQDLSRLIEIYKKSW